LELYFRLFPGAIRSPQIIEFLWDGLPARRSRAVWDFVRQQQGRIWLEFLPALCSGTESDRIHLGPSEAT